MKLFNQFRQGSGSGAILSRLMLGIWVAVILAALFQVIRYSESENVYSVGEVIIGCALFTLFYSKQEILANYPFSSLAIAGFALTRLILPLIFISLEDRPLIHNLVVPTQDFGWSVGVLALFLVIHALYRRSSAARTARRWLSNSPLQFLGVFTVPTEIQIWLIGAVGLFAQIYKGFFAGDQVASQSGQAVVKFIAGFLPFAYLPFLAVFPKLYASTASSTKAGWIRMIIFMVALLVISMATNSRSTFMWGLFALGLAYLLGILINIIRLRLSLTQVIMIGMGLLLLIGPLQDLSSALIVAREYRGNVTTMDLIEITMEAYQNKSTLRASHEIETEIGSETEFAYFTSPFLNRFCNVKFADTSLFMASQLDASRKAELRLYTWKHFLSTFPTPIILMLGLPAEKDVTIAASYGDEIVVLSTGKTDLLGGLFTGDIIGTSLGAYGLWFLVGLVLLSFPLFVLIDSLALPPAPTSASLVEKGSQPALAASYYPRFSILGLLGIGTFFTLLSPESIEVLGSYMARYWFQSVLLYALLFKLTRLRLSN